MGDPKRSNLASLEQSKRTALANASGQETEALRLDGLANTCRLELSHKRDQLQWATRTLNACGAVVSHNQRFEGDFNDYARHIAMCLCDISISTSLRRLTGDNDALARRARDNANDLVNQLLREIGSLQNQLNSLEQQARNARSRAANYRANASRIQNQINMQTR